MKRLRLPTILLSWFVLCCTAFGAEAEPFGREAIALVCHGGGDAGIWVAADEPSCVRMAASDIAEDAREATGKALRITPDRPKTARVVVIAGVVGSTPALRDLERRKLVDFSAIRGQWESFVIRPVSNPWPGVESALVVAGSDPRGAMYALYELSERVFGTDPMKFWTDHQPVHLEVAEWKDGELRKGPPAFRYRGLFLNDEEWLIGWKWNGKDLLIDPGVYAKVVETICRLKGNMIAPASYAGYMDDASQKLCNDRGLYYTASHGDILLANAMNYWSRFTQQRYGKRLPYSYITRPEAMREFWTESIRKHKNDLAIWPVGLRAEDDRDFAETDPSAPKSAADRAIYTSRVVGDEMKLLRDELGAASCPVTTLTMRGDPLTQYKTGKLTLPEETILIWQDNACTATMPCLPATGEERFRKGGNGVYYHASYCDNPWVQWVPLEVVQSEFGKILEAGANRYLLLNVQNIRPVPMTIKAVMDLAWDAKPWKEDASYHRKYLEGWAGFQFGNPFAKEAGDLYERYWALEYPCRATSVVEATAPYVASYERTPNHHEVSATALARVVANRDILVRHAAAVTVDNVDERYGKLTGAWLAETRPKWDVLYEDARTLSAKIPPERRRFFFSNVILQIQTSRLVNHWAVEALNGFEACAKDDFGSAVKSFNSAADAMAAIQDERMKDASGKWLDWYRGDYLPLWINCNWTLKPDWLAAETRQLAQAIAPLAHGAAIQPLGSRQHVVELRRDESSAIQKYTMEVSRLELQKAVKGRFWIESQNTSGSFLKVNGKSIPLPPTKTGRTRFVCLPVDLHLFHEGTNSISWDRHPNADAAQLKTILLIFENRS